MQYKLDSSTSPSSNKSDCIVVAIFSTKKQASLSRAAAEIDKTSQGALSKIIKSGDFKGSLEETQILYSLEGVEATRVLMIGCGDEDSFNTVALNKAVKAASKAIKTSKIKSLSLYLAETINKADVAQAATQTIIAHGDCDWQTVRGVAANSGKMRATA